MSPATSGVPLVAVPGHERRGALDAAPGAVRKSATCPGSLGPMIEPIIAAVLQATSKKAGLQGDELLDAAVRENARRVVAKPRSSDPVTGEPLRAGRLKIVSACGDLDDRNVGFFDV